jgi:hypothetical protein
MVVIYFRLFLELDILLQSFQRWNVECNMIQIIVIIVTVRKIDILIMGSMCHTSHL